MKKGSIFKRLSNSLRFDDDEDELEEETRELVLETNKKMTGLKEKEEALLQAEKEEIAELPVDVYELPSEIIVQTLIAGVIPDHLTLSISRDNIKISGKREESKSSSNQEYQIKELYWGKFERHIDLPAEIDIDGAEAIERHGMLIIKLPKLDKGRKNMLKIKSI